MGKIIGFTVVVAAIMLQGCLKDADLIGMVYTGQSVDERVEQSLAYNAVHGFKQVVISENEYTLFVMGDSHLGGTTNFEAFLQRAEQGQAAGLVFCGDLVTGHKEDYEVFFNLLPDFSSMPYFPVVGNHDLYFKGWEHYLQYFGTSTYYFTVQTPAGTDFFLCLDSGSGTIGGVQLKWLEYWLTNLRPNYRHCAVFTHHNIFRNTFDTAASPNLEENYKFIDLMTQHNVNIVVQGHSHKRSEDVFGNTNYVVMDALKLGDDKAGYLKLNVSPAKISYQLERVN